MADLKKEYNEIYGEIPEDPKEIVSNLLERLTAAGMMNYEESCKRIKKRKWIKKQFVFYILPKATPRPRLGRNGIFYVKGASDNKKFFKNFIKDEDINIIKTPTKFRCTSYLPTPKSMRSYEKVLAELGLIYPVSKPDWDNLAKAYSDMIQGLLLYDDALIIDGSSRKFYSMKPRIEIEIEYLSDFDSDFNKKKFKER